MDKNIALQNLLEISQIFEHNGLEYWLDAGTLLGAIRDGKFIPWDEDVDLGTWYSNIPKMLSLSREFAKRGFTYILNEGDFALEKNGCKVEFLLYHSQDNKAVYTLFITRNSLGSYLDSFHQRLSLRLNSQSHSPGNSLKPHKIDILIRILPISLLNKMDRFNTLLFKKAGAKSYVYYVPSIYFKSLSKTSLYGFIFKIPCNVERYLIFRYGENWCIPDRSWVYHTAIPALADER